MSGKTKCVYLQAYIHAMENHLTIKRNTDTCYNMNGQNHQTKLIIQTQKTTLHDSIYMKCSEKVDLNIEKADY